jgi:hypothetical protein
MGEKLPPDEMRIYQRVDEILHYLWDPIGVAGAAGARDEYYGYLPVVYQMVMEEAPVRKIAVYLNEVERDRMGLIPNPERALEVAEVMAEHRKWILK